MLSVDVKGKMIHMDTYTKDPWLGERVGAYKQFHLNPMDFEYINSLTVGSSGSRTGTLTVWAVR